LITEAKWHNYTTDGLNLGHNDLILYGDVTFMNYCSNCGTRVTFKVPPGDERKRYVCDVCNTIYYENPKVVVGCIPQWEDKVLLCRRSIEPRYGKWTLPAGYMENGETVSEGAKREVLEEAGTQVHIISLYGLYNLSSINQIYIIFLARMINDNFSPGSESLDARLFDRNEIPWDELAFIPIQDTLRQYINDWPSGKFPFHMTDITLEK